MSKVDRFWSHEAQNIRCVRESDYDRDTQALKAENEKFAEALEVATGKAIAERDALRAQVEAMREDAARYRWMRSSFERNHRHGLAALAGQQQQGEPHNCDLEGGHLPIGWGGLVFCELCSARLPDEPALAEAEQPVIYPEDGQDERVALSTALFNALESYEASRGKFSRKDQKIHAEQCELIRQHAAQLLAGQPAAVDWQSREIERLTLIADRWQTKVNELERELTPHRIAAGRALFAPAAVVLPEPVAYIFESGTVYAGTDIPGHYRNDRHYPLVRVDEIARLNRRTVPLELLKRIAKVPRGSQGLIDNADALDELRTILAGDSHDH